MAAAIVLGTRLALGVGFDQEAAEIRNPVVDFIDLGLPPRPHAGIEGIRALQPSQLDRGAEARAQINLDAVGAKDCGQRLDLLEVGLCQNESVGVDVRQHRAVDAYRGARARIVRVAWVVIVRKGEPIPDGVACVAALYRPVQVVPVVENPVLYCRGGEEVCCRQRLVCLYQPEEMKGSMQDACIIVCRNHRGAVARDRHCNDSIAFGARRFEIELKRGNRRGRSWSAEYNGSVT